MKPVGILFIGLFALAVTAFSADDDTCEGVVKIADKNYLYGGAALVYHRTYSTDSGWFDDGAVSQDETGALEGIFGYNYNDYLAFEARVYTSLWSRDYADLSGWSLFVKPQYYFARNWRVYALLGFGKTKVEGYDGDTPAPHDVVGKTIADDTSFQWGFGVSFDAIDDWTLFIDYTVLADDVSIDSRLYDYDPVRYRSLNTDGLHVGLTYRF